MNTPTPRTDAAASESIVKVHETSQQLETELTAALAEIDRLDVAGIHSCHANCQKSMCVMRRELTAVTEQRDELAESLEFQFKLNRECIDQITTRTKERDEAREAAQKAKAYKRVLKETNAQLKRERDEAREELAAVIEQRDELRRWTSVNGVIDLQCQRDEARGQRDRLAEALEQLMAYQPRSTVITTNERHVWSNAKDALQSLNQP